MKMWIKLLALLVSCALNVLMEEMFKDTVKIGAVNNIPSNEFLLTGDQEDIHEEFDVIPPEAMVGRWWFIKSMHDGKNVTQDWVILPTGEMGIMNGMSRPHIVSSDNQDVFPSSEGWYKISKYYYYEEWGYVRLNKDRTLRMEYFCDRCSYTFHGLNNHKCSAIGLKRNILFMGTFYNRPHQLFHGEVKSDNRNVETCYEEAISKGTNYFGVSDSGRKCYANDPNAWQTYNKNPFVNFPFNEYGSKRTTSVYKLLKGNATDVVFNPKMIGRWYLGKYEIVLNADGTITDMRVPIVTDVLSASDNQEQFPTKDGWFKVVKKRLWGYLRLINGKLEYHFFSNNVYYKSFCKRKYKGLRHYCVKSTGIRQDFENVGCFKDNDADRAFKGGSIIVKSKKTYNKVRDCYFAALENNVTYFGIRDYNHCYAMDPEAGNTYSKYGRTSGCYGGIGKKMVLNVYRLKDTSLQPKTTTPPVVGKQTIVVFYPEMVGRWYLYYPKRKEMCNEIILNADGMITSTQQFIETLVLTASDNEVQFPTKDGWFKVANTKSWVYVRPINGNLEWHYFCDNDWLCKEEYQGLENYCCKAIGIRQDI